jgi:hypothetical protein
MCFAVVSLSHVDGVEEELYICIYPRPHLIFLIFFLYNSTKTKILGRDIVVYAKPRLVAPSIQLRLLPLFFLLT